MIEYKPYKDRIPDTQYNRLLEYIIENGTNKKPIHATLEENAGSGHSIAREATGMRLSFDLSNGFPIFGHRNIQKIVTGATGEIAGFLNGARTLEELVSYGCPKIFWERWVTKEKCAVWGLKEGDLGPGSYGPTLRAFPTPDGPFDQLAALNEGIKRFPMSRGLMITTRNPALTLGSKDQGIPRQVVVEPCHGTEFLVTLFPEENEMEVTCVQRSSDVPVGMIFNIPQWCLLGLVFAMIHGYTFTRYTHLVMSAQIYDVQFEAVQKLLEREVRKFPTVELQPPFPYKNPWDLRKDHLVIYDYDPHPFFPIDTPI